MTWNHPAFPAKTMVVDARRALISVDLANHPEMGLGPDSVSVIVTGGFAGVEDATGLAPLLKAGAGLGAQFIKVAARRRLAASVSCLIEA